METVYYSKDNYLKIYDNIYQIDKSFYLENIKSKYHSCEYFLSSLESTKEYLLYSDNYYKIMCLYNERNFKNESLDHFKDMHDFRLVSYSQYKVCAIDGYEHNEEIELIRISRFTDKTGDLSLLIRNDENGTKYFTGFELDDKNIKEVSKDIYEDDYNKYSYYKPKKHINIKPLGNVSYEYDFEEPNTLEQLWAFLVFCTERILNLFSGGTRLK